MSRKRLTTADRAGLRKESRAQTARLEATRAQPTVARGDDARRPRSAQQQSAGRSGGNGTQPEMLLGRPKSARCVQRFDDSLNPAIRTTYRISLRSSSLREPRHSLLGVVFVSWCAPADDRFGSPADARAGPQRPAAKAALARGREVERV